MTEEHAIEQSALEEAKKEKAGAGGFTGVNA